ncbi:MAG TPA: nucleotidyltransferase family protein [Allosphingosinicella sp.]|nr:nucleotidyltransferase family protein [Allosphingosinicella sp.]
MKLPQEALDLPADEVRCRLDAAHGGRGSGWMWPEVDEADWHSAQRALADVAAATLGGRPAPELRGEPRALAVAGYTSGIGPLIGHWIERDAISAEPDAAALFELQLRHNRLRSARLRSEALAAVSLLHGAGIEPTVLKGIHTGFDHFPEPGARPCSDIDLLVPGHLFGAAEAAMQRSGYLPGRSERIPIQRAWRRPDGPAQVRSLSLVHADDPWAVDLQGSLDRKFAPSSVARLQGLADRRPRARWSQDPGAAVLAQPLLAIHLASHASNGLQSLNLLRLVEIVLVLRREPVDWRELVEAAADIDALGFLYPAFGLAEQLVPGTVPQEVIAACAAEAPAAVRAVVADHDPSSIHRVARLSSRESLMWCRTRRSRLAVLLLPGVAGGTRAAIAFYRRRLRIALTLLRGG